MKEVIVNRNPIKDNSFSIRDYDFGYKKEYIYNTTLYLIEDHSQMEKIGRQLLENSDIMALKGDFVGRGIYVPEAIPVIDDEFVYIVNFRPFADWARNRLSAQSIRHKMICDDEFKMANYVDDFRHINNVLKIVENVYKKAYTFPVYPETKNLEETIIECFKIKVKIDELKEFFVSGSMTEKHFKMYINLARTKLNYIDAFLQQRIPKEYIDTQERYNICMHSYPEYFMWKPDAYKWSNEILDANDISEIEI